MKGLVTLVIFLIFLGYSHTGFSQDNSDMQQDSRMQWWHDARFGMFIHWGLYAIPAGEWNGKNIYGEWIRHSGQIPIEVYDRFQEKFNPVKFNAKKWVRLAKEAGMKYIVITSKHHDGFCMFDTEQTHFNIMETPFGRDVMKELAGACRKYDMKLCFYYSIMDWHHPDYLPRRDWETGRPADGADFDRYVDYMKRQLKELLTQYGDIGVLWFDGEWESTWTDKYGKEIYYYVRNLQPDILINNRVGAGRLDMAGMTGEGAFGGDFGTPEQQIPSTGLPGKSWETCMTMNDHWGYNQANTNYKSTEELIRMLTDIASKGGNYLLNVGPTAKGIIPHQSVERLKQIGKWMKVNGESIYETQASPFSVTSWGRCTMKKGEEDIILYLHVFNWPEDGCLVVPGCLNDPASAILLADPGKKLAVNRKDNAIVINLPAEAPDPANSVIKLKINGKLDLTNPPEIKAGFDLFVDRLKIEFVSDRPNVEIRFTEDGTDPVNTSLLYTEPLEIHREVTVKARCFREGKPVSGIASRSFTMVIPNAAKRVENPEPGIRYQYFEGEWDSLPDFSKLTPLKTGILPDFSFQPAIEKERFGFVYTGYVKIPECDIYTFYTESDDGSCLYIGRKKVVDNDGLHSLEQKKGSIGLSKGFHKIRVLFFEKTGSDALKIYLKSPTIDKQILPKDWLYH